MALSEYQRKRHFSKTPEPKAIESPEQGWKYVIQKHDASHLHYDFRLELNGVLKSWAVPKGPSLDPKVKRLAVEVEDHPVAYGDFEGVIPAGEYGGGTVLLWDNGTWTPLGDPVAGLRAGRLKFALSGQKLRGHWMLLRLSRQTGHKPQWLLIKEVDDEAQSSSKSDILDLQPFSVTSGRDLKEIAHAGAPEWPNPVSEDVVKSHPRKTAPSPKPGKRKGKSKQTRNAVPLPDHIDVELATLVDSAPEGDDWLHEVKFDGYRMICRVDGDDVQFITRNHQNWTSRVPHLVDAARALPVSQVILDGEVVALTAEGTTDFQTLQNAFRDHQDRTLKYYVFDLLFLDGNRWIDRPLIERKQRLEELLSESKLPGDVFRYSDHIQGHGDELQRQACEMHLEGIVSKRANAYYQAGRGHDWLKSKCRNEDEYVIGGFTDPSGSRSGFGALLVGAYDSEHHLHYAGKVGTGFDQKTLRELSAELDELEIEESPFSDLRRRVGDARTAHWVQPSLVGQFRFANRTRDGKLRHGSFLGLRKDKPATEVTTGTPTSTSRTKSQTLVTQDVGSKKSARQKQLLAKSAQPAVRNLDVRKAKSETSEVANVKLSHPEKVLYPSEGLTKFNLARYYEEISPWILPHMKHRPIVLVRCPGGQESTCFYQKHPATGVPDSIRRIAIKEKQKTEDYLLIDDVKDLVALVQIDALELHVWGSREDKLESPDRLVFDLDPAPEVAWKTVVTASLEIRDFLLELGLKSFVKTTGGKGLHLVLPIDRRHSWDEAKSFCKRVAEAIVSIAPKQFTALLSKSARSNKIFIDYLRNGRGATAVVAYSSRARDQATVSTPVSWDELKQIRSGSVFTIQTLPERMKLIKADPWADLMSTRQSLNAPMKKLQLFVNTNDD